MRIKFIEAQLMCKEKSSQNNKLFDTVVNKTIAPFLVWIFINIGLRGNQVLIVCASIEILGIFMLFTQKILFMAFGILLLFFGVILDLLDGTVRKYWNESRVWGIYLDRVMHRLVYPLCYIAIGIYAYLLTSKIEILYFAISAALFNELNYFNKIFKILLIGNDKERPTPTRLIRDNLEKTIHKKMLFYSVLMLKRLYDYVFCNWVQYLILLSLLLLYKVEMFILFYGIGEPLKWVMNTYLDVKFYYVPDKSFPQNVYW